MAQRRSPGSRKSKAKPKAKSKAKAKRAVKATKVTRKTKIKAKPKAKSKAAALPKAAKSTARRTTRAVQGRRSQARTASKPGVETRPEDMDARRRNSGHDAGFAYEEEPRSAADESFSPGNYVPGQVGEPKVAPRRRASSNRGRESETELLPGSGPRAATDGAAEPSPGQTRAEHD